MEDGLKSTGPLRRALKTSARSMAKATAKLNDEPNLRTLVLWGITETAVEHVIAITTLVAHHFVRSSKVLLRTMIEGWIVAKFVMQVDNDERARAYVLTAPESTLKVLTRLGNLIERFPEKEQWILASAGLRSRSELDERATYQKDQINDLRTRRVPKPMPSILGCARALGPEYEVTYASVYGYLLSDQVHMGAGDALNQRLQPGEATNEGGDERRVLITALYLLTELAEEVNSHSGRPTRAALKRMQLRLQSFASESP